MHSVSHLLKAKLTKLSDCMRVCFLFRAIFDSRASSGRAQQVATSVVGAKELAPSALHYPPAQRACVPVGRHWLWYKHSHPALLREVRPTTRHDCGEWGEAALNSISRLLRAGVRVDRRANISPHLNSGQASSLGSPTCVGEQQQLLIRDLWAK